MKFNLSNVERNESLIWGLLLALITSLPYMVGYLTSPENRYYLGFVLNAGDSNTYFMWMSQVLDGQLLLKNLYTAIPHDGVMFNLVFVVGGWIGQLTGSLDIAYQALRVLAVIFLSWSSWLFIALFVHNRTERRIVFFVLVFGAGLSWIWNVYRLLTGDFGSSINDIDLLTRPVDLWVPEGFVFYSMLVMPHFTVAIGCLLMTIRYAALGLFLNRLGYTLAAGLFCFALSFVHPYDVLIALGLSGMVIFLGSLRNGFNWSIWRHLLILFLISVGPILYNYVILYTNPGMKAWLVQNKSGSPAPWSYIAGYGLLFLAGYSNLWMNRRDVGSNYQPIQWVYAWLLILPFVLYAPIDFQRRLVIGASVPFAVLTSMLYIEFIKSRALLKKNVKAIMVISFITILSMTSIFHFLNSFRKATEFSGDLYVDTGFIEVSNELNARKNSQDIVLSTFEIGNYLPRFTGITTVIGSRGQTGDFDSIKRKTDLFFNGKYNKFEMNEFIDEQRASWIIISDHDNHELYYKLKDISFDLIRKSNDGKYILLKKQ